MKPGYAVLLAVVGLWADTLFLLLEAANLEGVVPLPAVQNPSPLPRYPGQNIQPSPPEPPTAVVYLESPSFTPMSARPVVQVRQRGLQFIPSVVPIQTGTVVEFPNEDDLYHNVFSYSKPRRFDLGRYRKDEKPASQRFDKPGVVRLNCEIHAHMRGYILVLNTPYFTRTDTNGAFRLENLPAGEFLLKAWLSDQVTLQQRVVLKDGETLPVRFKNGDRGFSGGSANPGATSPKGTAVSLR